jgi:hypothetical protein
LDTLSSLIVSVAGLDYRNSSLTLVLNLSIWK